MIQFGHIPNATIRDFMLDSLTRAQRLRDAQMTQTITLAPHEYRNIPAHIADSAMRKEGAI